MDEDPDDVRALRRMLPSLPAERDFPAGRRSLRENHLRDGWAGTATRSRNSARLVPRLALSVAAVAAATVLVLDPSSAPRHHRAVSAGPPKPTRLSTTSYTLEREPDDSLRIVIRDVENGVDTDRLRADLSRLGVQSSVSAGVTQCLRGGFSVVRRDRNGDYVADVHLAEPSQRPDIVVFPVGPGSSHMLTITFDSPSAPSSTCTATAENSR